MKHRANPFSHPRWKSTLFNPNGSRKASLITAEKRLCLVFADKGDRDRQSAMGGGSERQRAALAVLLVVSLFLAPAASFGPTFLGGLGRLGSFVPPRGEGGWRAAGQVVLPKATLLSRNQLFGKRQGARLSMMSERDISDETTLPTGLLEELDSGVRLNDLLLVQDFVTVGTTRPLLPPKHRQVRDAKIDIAHSRCSQCHGTAKFPAWLDDGSYR